MNPIRQTIESFLIPAFTYKHGSLVLMSTPLALAVDYIYKGSFFGIGLTFIILLGTMIVVDFFTGLIASRYEGHVYESQKVAFTFYKIFSYFFFFWIVWEVNKAIPEESTLVYNQGRIFLSFIRTFVFIILCLREYISIGENIQRRFGKKPYIFTLVEKLTELVENKFIKKIEDSDFFDSDKSGN